jgi:TRAP-type C4-dicarboxylate transport system substrate-binding protein
MKHIVSDAYIYCFLGLEERNGGYHMKKRILVLVLAFVLVFAFAACGSGSGDKGSAATPPAAGSGGGTTSSGDVDKSDWIKLDLNAASYLPANDTMLWLQGNYTDGVTKALGEDYVTLTWHNSGTLVDQDGAYDGLLAGTADIVLIEISSFSDMFPVSNLWCQPGLGSGSSTGGTAAYTEWAQQHAWDLDEFKDMIVLSGQNNGPAVIISKNKIEKPEDTKGIQFRSTATISPTIEGFGGTPIVIPAMETYEALRNGMVTASYSTFGGQAILGWTEFTPYTLALNLNSDVYVYAMNKDSFAKMPKSQQQAFLDGWSDGFYSTLVPGWYWYMDVLSEPIVGGAQSVEWTFATKEQEEPFLKLTEPVLAKYVDNLKASGVDDVDGIIASIRAAQDKWIAGWATPEWENQLYEACAAGTYEDYKANYKIPDNIPTPAPYLLP